MKKLIILLLLPVTVVLTGCYEKAPPEKDFYEDFTELVQPILDSIKASNVRMDKKGWDKCSLGELMVYDKNLEIYMMIIEAQRKAIYK